MAADSTNTKLNGALVSVDPTTGRYALQVSGLGSGDIGTPIETSIPVAARQTSIRASGEQTAPTAGTDICATAALDQGTWEIDIHAAIGGTTVAAMEAFNVEVLNAGASYSRVIVPVPGTAGGSGVGHLKYRYDGSGVITVQAAENATAASHYCASIVATRIN